MRIKTYKRLFDLAMLHGDITVYIDVVSKDYSISFDGISTFPISKRLGKNIIKEYNMKLINGYNTLYGVDL